MANRSIKGVLARNSWDFYEYSTAWAFSYASWTSSTFFAAVINDGTQQGNMDVYKAQLCAEPGILGTWFAFQVPGAIPPSIGLEEVVHCCETNQPHPLGQVGTWATQWFQTEYYIRASWAPVTFDEIQVQEGGPFITLAPGWGLGLLQQTGVAATVGITVWYQVILDQVSQAR